MEEGEEEAYGTFAATGNSHPSPSTWVTFQDILLRASGPTVVMTYRGSIARGVTALHAPNPRATEPKNLTRGGADTCVCARVCVSVS